MQEGGLNSLQGDRRAAQLGGGGETKRTCSLCVSGADSHPSTAGQGIELNFFFCLTIIKTQGTPVAHWRCPQCKMLQVTLNKNTPVAFTSFLVRFCKMAVMISWFFFTPPKWHFPPESLRHRRCSSVAVVFMKHHQGAVLLQPPLAVPQGLVLFGCFGVPSPACSLLLTSPVCLRNAV